MKQERIILLLVTVVVVLSIILLTGVGYAVETENTLKISDNVLLEPGQSDFMVVFSGEPTYRGKGVAKLNITGTTTATINITELKSVGDSVTAIFTIENKSDYLYADIDAKVSNTNTEYFSVTSRLEESRINPKNGKTTLEINVKLIKLPIYKEEKASICINIFAYPND